MCHTLHFILRGQESSARYFRNVSIKIKKLSRPCLYRWVAGWQINCSWGLLTNLSIHEKENPTWISNDCERRKSQNIFLISNNIYCCCWTFQLNHEVLNVIHYYSIMRTNLERSQVYGENIIIINASQKDAAWTSETITPGTIMDLND